MLKSKINFQKQYLAHFREKDPDEIDLDDDDDDEEDDCCRPSTSEQSKPVTEDPNADLAMPAIVKESEKKEEMKKEEDSDSDSEDDGAPQARPFT